jgi:hypothetical protein
MYTLDHDLCRQRVVKVPESDVEELRKVLKRLQEEDPGSVVEMGKDESSNELNFLFFQTSAMVRLFEEFHEVLQLDGTYGTNDLNFPLLTFLSTDGELSGRIVAHCFLKTEDLPSVKLAVETFKAKNPSIASTGVVVMDKDMTEISAVKDVLENKPSCELCEFHVAQTFNRETKKVPKAIRLKVRGILQGMIRARTEAIYLKHYETLKQVAGPSSKFLLYFQRNWHTCSGKWRKYERKFNLGNSTNNRLESQNQKIKQCLGGKRSLAIAVERLWNLNRETQRGIRARATSNSAKVHYHARIKDTRTVELLQGLTLAARKVIIQQLYRMESGNVFRLAKKKNCACFRSGELGLPCKHKLARAVCEGSIAKARRHVHPRYLQERTARVVIPSSSRPNVSQASRLTSTHRVRAPLDKTRRYNAALGVAKAACDVLSLHGGKDFDKGYELLRILADVFRNKRSK